MSERPSPMLRLLIIDDSNERIATIRDWLPDDVHPVIAASPGRALKVLDLDPGTVYAGILLDHDLGQQVSQRRSTGSPASTWPRELRYGFQPASRYWCIPLAIKADLRCSSSWNPQASPQPASDSRNSPASACSTGSKTCAPNNSFGQQPDCAGQPP